MYIQNITLLTFPCYCHAESVCLIKSNVKLHVKKFWVEVSDGETC